jgi:signal transduction histidine kinase
MHRIAFVVILSFLLHGKSFSQRSVIDSLKKENAKKNPPIPHAELNTLIAFNYLNINNDTALYFSNQAIRISKEDQVDTTLVKAYIIKCYALENLGEIDEALACNDTAIAQAEKFNRPRQLFSAYMIRGTLYRRKARYAEALDFYLKCTEIAEKNNYEDLMAKSYSMLGVFHMSRRNLEESERFHLKALAMRQKMGNDKEIYNSYENLGIVNREKGEYRKALDFYFKALKIVETMDDSLSLSFCYNDIGAAYSFLGETVTAEKYLKESIRIREKLHAMDEIAYTYNYLGENEERKGDLKAAAYWIHRALDKAIEIGNHKQHAEALESLSDFFARNKMADSAYHYLKLHKSYKDSLQKADNEEIIAKLRTKYETSKKEQIIHAQSYALSKQNWYLAILLSILILGGIASWLFFRNRQHQQKKKLQQTIMEQQDLATKAVLQAEENERQRIAADLHDGVGQMLTAVRLNLQGLQDRIQLNKEEDRLIYEKVLCMMDESSKEVRTVSHTIMPNALIKTGLGNAIKDFVEKIENNQILIQLHTQGLNDKLETHIEIVVYRIVQECVKNVIKHSKANKLDISIIRDDDGLRVTVEDNGTGFNKSELEKKSGIGMKNIRARIEYLKGSLDVDTQPGKGTLVAFFIPTH